jgi:uncharacterized protein involved in outer membrane biogenesis
VHEKSGRQIAFEELHIGLSSTFDPVIRFRGLQIENAAWAAARPLARAGELTFTVSWRSLGAERTIVKRLVLVDADIDLEMQADGLRNWRLTHPDDRGPGKVWVLAIDAQRSRLRFVNRGIDLELDAAIAPLTPVHTLSGSPGLPLTKWLVVHGSHKGAAFDAQTAVSDVLSFRDTDSRFALRGSLKTGSTRIDAEGTAADILQLRSFDVALNVATPRLADLRPLLPAASMTSSLPTLAPISATANVRRTGPLWAVSQLRATVGHSDIAGDADFQEGNGSDQRPTLRASLNSTLIDIPDLGDFGNAAKSAKASRPAKAADSTAARMVATHSLDTSALTRIDADLKVRLNELTGVSSASMSKLKAQATLRGGKLDLTDIELRIAGGRATATLMVDASRKPSEVAVELNLTGVQLDRLKHTLASSPPKNASDIAGGLEARIALHSHGDSMAALANAANGSVNATLNRASISKTLDAKLGLDGGALMRAWFEPNERLQVTCSNVAIDFSSGHGKTRVMFETGRTAISGGGSVNLPQESLDIILTPHRKTTALLALDRSMHVQGSLHSPKFSLVDKVESKVPQRCEDQVAIVDPANAAGERPAATASAARHTQRSQARK